MKSIASHLRPYVMLARRRTTINHAFAAAIAPSERYDEVRVAAALTLLGMDPDAGLPCAYCNAAAETWDHVHATVRNSRFSGHGHRLGNLLPCCRPCNSKKGNKSWEGHLRAMSLSEAEWQWRHERISAYLARYAADDEAPVASAAHVRLDQIRQEVLSLLAEGDRIAADIRASPAPMRANQPD